MSLTLCPNCRLPVNDSQERCPLCTAPMTSDTHAGRAAVGVPVAAALAVVATVAVLMRRSAA